MALDGSSTRFLYFQSSPHSFWGPTGIHLPGSLNQTSHSLRYFSSHIVHRQVITPTATSLSQLSPRSHSQLILAAPSLWACFLESTSDVVNLSLSSLDSQDDWDASADRVLGGTHDDRKREGFIFGCFLWLDCDSLDLREYQRNHTLFDPISSVAELRLHSSASACLLDPCGWTCDCHRLHQLL